MAPRDLREGTTHTLTYETTGMQRGPDQQRTYVSTYNAVGQRLGLLLTFVRMLQVTTSGHIYDKQTVQGLHPGTV